MAADPPLQHPIQPQAIAPVPAPDAQVIGLAEHHVVVHAAVRKRFEPDAQRFRGAGAGRVRVVEEVVVDWFDGVRGWCVIVVMVVVVVDVCSGIVGRGGSDGRGGAAGEEGGAALEVGGVGAGRGGEGGKDGG